MEILSVIVIILLSLVGYCGGAVSKAGKLIDLEPKIFDLILVTIIWTGAIYSRMTLDLNKWLLIIIVVFLSIIIGRSTLFFRSLPDKKIAGDKKPPRTSANIFSNLWQRWKNFSKRMGIFQSKLILSLFFFIVVSPFALAVKIFSDPLRIKHKSSKSHWLSKREIKATLEQYRRQF